MSLLELPALSGTALAQRWLTGKRVRWLRRAGCLLLLLAAQVSAAAAPAPVTVAEDAATQRLSSALLIIPDRGRALELDAVAAGQYDADALPATRLPANLGYPPHPYWLRLRLYNPSEQPLQRLLVLWRGAAQAQTLRIVREGHADTVHLGRGSDRTGDVYSRHQALRLVLPPHAVVAITSRVESRVALVLDYRLLTEVELARSDAVDYGFFGILLGTELTIGLFVLALWLGLGERIYLWFSGFALGIVVYQLHAEGYAYFLLGPGWQVPGSYVGAYFGAAQAMCLVLLVREFVTTPATAYRLDRFVIWPLLGLLALVFPLFPIQPWLANTTVALAVLVSGAVQIALVLASLVRRTLKNRCFFAALLLHWLAVTVFLLKRAGGLPDLAIITILPLLTTALAMLMFALALSLRMRAIANENRTNLQQYAERLEVAVAERTGQYRTAAERAEQALLELQQAQKQLVQQEKMASLGSLVAGVAHEVNTPLGVALTASSHLGMKSHEVAGQVQTGHLRRSELLTFINTAEQSSQMIEHNLDRAAHLIQSFKQVAVDRSSDGRRRFELRDYLRDLVESLEHTWSQRPLTLRLDCPPQLLMDSFPGALGQVLGNLIENSLLHAFAPEQTGQMVIAVQERTGSELDIVFSDNGKGVSSDVISHIFEPFFTTRRNQGGTGLGMHVAYNLVVQKLGGAIRVESLPNAGVQFVLSLPKVAPEPLHVQSR